MKTRCWYRSSGAICSSSRQYQAPERSPMSADHSPSWANEPVGSIARSLLVERVLAVLRYVMGASGRGRNLGEFPEVAVGRHVNVELTGVDPLV